jgi:energy-coupling factor transporter ATP-binding protein EcfA2
MNCWDFQDNRTKSTWDKMNKNDLCLMYQDKKIIMTGLISYKFRNAAVAAEIWEESKKPFEYIFCFKDVHLPDIPSKDVLMDEFDYSAEFIMGANPLAQKRLEKVLDKYGTVDNFRKNIEKNYKISSEEEPMIRESERLPVKQKLSQIKNYIKAQSYTYPDNLIENFYLSLKTKPFVLLAGISGTGKTKLVELFARAIGCSSDNDRFKLISVKPDWNDSADLLGYSNIRGDFQPGPILDTIKKASEDPTNPYLVCLDEMNLARVEYYFSDFLSKMETRHFAGNQIKTDRLLNENDFDQNDSNDSKAKYSNLHIPDNLYLIGTVNMDETTHPFSKKVLDRANTIEFNQIELTAFLEEDYSDSAQSLKVNNEFLKTEYLNLKDLLPDEKEEVRRITEELERLNQILKKANLQVGYRIRDEINFYIVEALDKELLDYNTAFDKEILQKVLPRIQGSSAIIKEILLELFDFFTGANYSSENGQLAARIWNYYQANQESFKYPESAEKIAYMLRRFEEDGFTSYWL